MNQNLLEEDVLRYALGWGESIGLRAFLGLLALALLAGTLTACCRRRISAVPSVLWLLAGAGLLVFALLPQQVITFVVRTEYLMRVRVIVGGLSLLVLLISFESIRRTHLQERYALLWIGTALVILLCAIFPHAVALLRAVMGMNYATAVVSVAFTFLFLVAFHFSISLSDIQSRNSKMAQKIAMLEAELKARDAKQK